MENFDLIPNDPHELRQQFSAINDYLNSNLTLLPEDLRKLPEKEDFESYAQDGEKLIIHMLETGDQGFLKLGALLNIIKVLYGDGKKNELIGRWGYSRRTAETYMRDQRIFGDHPEITEGMGSSKLERLASLPPEYLDQILKSGTVVLLDGTEIPLMRWKSMTYRELNETVRQLKKDLSDEKYHHGEDQQEMKAMLEDRDKLERKVKALEHDANPVMAQELEKERELKEHYHQKYDDAIMELGIKNEKKLKGEEALKTFPKMEGERLGLCAAINRIDASCSGVVHREVRLFLEKIEDFIDWKRNELADIIKGNPELLGDE